MSRREPNPLAHEDGPPSIPARLALILGLIPLTAPLGMVLALIAFFRMTAAQHRAHFQAGVGFTVGLIWTGLIVFACLMLYVH